MWSLYTQVSDNMIPSASVKSALTLETPNLYFVPHKHLGPSPLIRLPYINHDVGARLKDLIFSYFEGATKPRFIYTPRENVTSSRPGAKLYFCIDQNCKVCPLLGGEHDRRCGLTNVIYQLECCECSKRYVGKTTRTLKSRINEHLASLRTGNRCSAMGTHILSEHGALLPNTGSNYIPFSVTVLHKAQDIKSLAVLEMYYIYIIKPCLNVEFSRMF